MDSKENQKSGPAKAVKSAPERPLCLELAEAKADIINAINAATKRQIPFFLLEDIVKDAARQVSEQAKAERVKAQRIYETQLAEYQAQENETKE